MGGPGEEANLVHFRGRDLVHHQLQRLAVHVLLVPENRAAQLAEDAANRKVV